MTKPLGVSSMKEPHTGGSLGSLLRLGVALLLQRRRTRA